jgi:hypothetical protein
MPVILQARVNFILLLKAFCVHLQLFDAGSLCRKVANYLGDVLEDQRDKLAENLLAAGVDLATYITQFR